MGWSNVKTYHAPASSCAGMQPFELKITESLNDVQPSEWDALVEDNYPFLKHAFLFGLEQHHCLQETGWHPQHFLLRDHTGQLVAAAPAYLKTNSFGEFVFDGSWASAYERSGRRYYPKLVLAAPFTPASGPRLLLKAHASEQQHSIKTYLHSAIITTAKEQQLSGIHCLFPNTEQAGYFQTQNWLMRFDYQYHWNNRGYTSFEEFLAEFRSHKRKNVKRERVLVKQQGIHIEIKHGNELSEDEWQTAFSFYQSTFYKKGNYPALQLSFFKSLGQSMGKQLVIMFALKDQQAIAAAIHFRSDTTLYGRYWGCNAEYNSLHFETCFYQGIEYCIQQGLQFFEPGAQGEHKILRGFLPTLTWSCHWIYDKDFYGAISRFLDQEKNLMQVYKQRLDSLAPFRKGQEQ